MFMPGHEGVRASGGLMAASAICSSFIYIYTYLVHLARRCFSHHNRLNAQVSSLSSNLVRLTAYATQRLP